MPAGGVGGDPRNVLGLDHCVDSLKKYKLSVSPLHFKVTYMSVYSLLCKYSFRAYS